MTISRYHVGTTALGSSGCIYLGINVEFPGVPLHHSIHTEQFLITNAAQHTETSILFIAVSNFPCGHCCQFLQEIRSSSQIQILITGSIAAGDDFLPLSYFLPHPFGPSNLLHEDHPLLLEPHYNDLIEVEGENCEICNGLGEPHRNNLIARSPPLLFTVVLIFLLILSCRYIGKLLWQYMIDVAFPERFSAPPMSGIPPHPMYRHDSAVPSASSPLPPSPGKPSDWSVQLDSHPGNRNTNVLSLELVTSLKSINERVVQISLTNSIYWNAHTFALTESGKLYAFGADDKGQLGIELVNR